MQPPGPRHLLHSCCPEPLLGVEILAPFQMLYSAKPFSYLCFY